MGWSKLKKRKWTGLGREKDKKEKGKASWYGENREERVALKEGDI